MVSATSVARYLESSKQISGRLHLQKLVYYSQAWALTWTGRPLFEEEIQAWSYGPVTPSVWDRQAHGVVDAEDAALLNPAQLAIVEAVFDHYGQIPGTTLSSMTHNESPWRDAWDDGRGKNSVITKSAMRRAYSDIASVNPRFAPRPPVIRSEVERASLLAAMSTERGRWRTLLDQLATE